VLGAGRPPNNSPSNDHRALLLAAKLGAQTAFGGRRCAARPSSPCAPRLRTRAAGQPAHRGSCVTEVVDDGADQRLLCSLRDGLRATRWPPDHLHAVLAAGLRRCLVATASAVEHCAIRCVRGLFVESPGVAQATVARPAGGPCAKPRSAGAGRSRRAAASRKCCLSSELGIAKARSGDSRASYLRAFRPRAPQGTPEGGEQSGRQPASPQGRSLECKQAACGRAPRRKKQALHQQVFSGVLPT
jgi:hypothetical protein